MNEPPLDTKNRHAGNGMPPNPVFRYTLMGVLLGIAFPLIATLIRLLEGNLQWNFANVVALHLQDPLLWIIDTAPFFLGLLAGLAGWRQAAGLRTNVELRTREQQLAALQSDLEGRVEDHTAELADRSALMRSLLSLTRQISEAADISTILTKAVDLIPQILGACRAGIYLLDESAGMAVLRASSSEGAAAGLELGQAIPIGAENVVGRAAAKGSIEAELGSAGLTAQQAGKSTAGEVVAEMAFPLTARGKRIGVLDFRPSEPRKLEQFEVEGLQLLSDHIAGAIESARLLEESRSSVAQLQNVVRQQTEAAWQEYFAHQTLAYQYLPNEVRSIPAGWRSHGPNRLRVPLDLRGERIGSVALQRQIDLPWSDAERDLVQKVAVQVALAIDNNRLLNETRQRALREQTVSELSARFSQSVEVDALLRSAVREFAALPEVTEAMVFLKMPETESGEADATPFSLMGYVYNGIRMDPVNTAPKEAMKALDTAGAVVGRASGPGSHQRQAAAIPILLRDERLGVLEVIFQGRRAPEGTISMLKQAADRLATAVENARLMQESFRRADKERMIAEITAKIGGSISMPNVLQTAVEELGRALPGSDVTIKLRAGTVAERQESGT